MLWFGYSFDCAFAYSIGCGRELIRIEINRGTAAGLAFNFSLLFPLSLGALLFLASLLFLPFGEGRAWS